MNSLTQAQHDQLFTNAEVLVAKVSRVKLHQKVGDNAQRYFDLASLTKPLATTLLFMIAVQDGLLTLTDTVDAYLPTTTLTGVTLTRLLNHTSPLTDWFDFKTIGLKKSAFAQNKKTILAQILNNKELLRHTPGVVYSDLGFMLLGAILETVHGDDLATLFAQQIAKPLGIARDAFFVPLHHKPLSAVSHFVPTEKCTWRKKLLQGEVMDENAFLMGGVAGHAGLFATATAVHRILSELRLARLGKSKFITRDCFQIFCEPTTTRSVAKRYFTLGFDTPTQPGSQSGKKFSKKSIGHLGYSGTSFWWDLQKDFWVILLTNRCIQGRENHKFATWRPEFYDQLVRSIL